jgi:hypothetical protein
MSHTFLLWKEKRNQVLRSPLSQCSEMPFLEVALKLCQ